MIKRIFSIAVAALMAATAWAATGDQKQDENRGRRQYQVFGVGFYNLENLFDTINANGSYDLEFSPQGARQERLVENQQPRPLHSRDVDPHHPQRPRLPRRQRD